MGIKFIGSNSLIEGRIQPIGGAIDRSSLII